MLWLNGDRVFGRQEEEIRNGDKGFDADVGPVVDDRAEVDDLEVINLGGIADGGKESGRDITGAHAKDEWD